MGLDGGRDAVGSGVGLWTSVIGQLGQRAREGLKAQAQAHVMMYRIALTRITNATDARLGVAAGDGMDGGGFSHSSPSARWSAGIMSVDGVEEELMAMCFFICS